MNFNQLKNLGPASLAPMAGVADSAFRALCKQFGAALVTSEMISIKALLMKDKKTAELLWHSDLEEPFAVQLFGDDPELFARCVPIIESLGPAFIDINMGCPAPKIAGNGAGSALLKDPQKCRDIMAACVGASKGVPITAKIRTGFTEDTKNGLEVAKLLQDAGAHYITVHGRTRERMYTPPVDLDSIAAIKSALSIPVVGNGDIYTPEDAKHMLDTCKVDHLYIGRGALGSPWIFAQINEYLKEGRVTTHLTPKEKFDCLLWQASKAIEQKGEKRAMSEMRKHAAWYFKGWRGAAALRRDAGKLATYEDLKTLVAAALISYEEDPDAI